jgi:hypothetical protein
LCAGGGGCGGQEIKQEGTIGSHLQKLLALDNRSDSTEDRKIEPTFISEIDSDLSCGDTFDSGRLQKVNQLLTPSRRVNLDEGKEEEQTELISSQMFDFLTSLRRQST